MRRNLLFFILLLGIIYLAYSGKLPFKPQIYAQIKDIFPVDDKWNSYLPQQYVASNYPLLDYVIYSGEIPEFRAFYSLVIQPPGSVSYTLHIFWIDSNLRSRSISIPVGNLRDLRVATAVYDEGAYHWFGVFRVNGKTYSVVAVRDDLRSISHNIVSASPSNLDLKFNRPVAVFYNATSNQLLVFFLMYADNPNTARLDIENYLVIDYYNYDTSTGTLSFSNRRVISVPFKISGAFRTVFISGTEPVIYFYTSGTPPKIYMYKGGSFSLIYQGEVVSFARTDTLIYIYKSEGGFWKFLFKYAPTGITVYQANVDSEIILKAVKPHVMLNQDNPLLTEIIYDIRRYVLGYVDSKGIIYGVPTFFFLGKKDANSAFSFRTDDLTKFYELDIAFINATSVVFHPSQAMVRLENPRGVYFLVAYKDEATGRAEIRYYYALPIYITISSPEDGKTYYVVTGRTTVPVNITIEDPTRTVARVAVYVTGTSCEPYNQELPIVIYNGTYQQNIYIEDISPLLVPLNPGRLVVEVYDEAGNKLLSRYVTFYAFFPDVGVKYYPADTVTGYTGETITQIFELYRTKTCGEPLHYNISLRIIQDGNVIIQTDPSLPGVYPIMYALNVTLQIYSKVAGRYSYEIIVNHTESPFQTSYEGMAIIEYQACNLSMSYPDGTTTKTFTFYVNRTNTLPVVIRNVGNITCEFNVRFSPGVLDFEVYYPEGKAIVNGTSYISPVSYRINPGETLNLNITVIPLKQGSYSFEVDLISDKYNLIYSPVTGTINAIAATCNAEITLEPSTINLWTSQTANLTLTITNLGNIKCSYDIGLNCPAGLTCILPITSTPQLSFGESVTTYVTITPVERGTYTVYAFAYARETGETFYSNNVTVVAESPIQIEILSPTQTELHQTSVLIHVRVKNLTKVTNPLTRILLNDELLYETTEPQFEFIKEVNITEGYYELKILFTSDEYTVSRRFSFYNDLIKYVRVLQPKSDTIYNLTEPIPIEVEAELWTPLTNATLLIFIDGFLYKEIPMFDLYIRHRSEVRITQPGMHLIYAMVASKEAIEMSPFVYFSIGMPPDYPVYNLTFREINYNDLMKIYHAWKLIYREINENDLRKLLEVYITRYLAVEDNEQIKKLVDVYLTQFREINENDLRKIFVVWLLRTLAIEDNNLSKIFKEYLVTTKEINVNDLYKLFREYKLADISIEDNSLRKIFAEFIIKSLATETNDLNKIFSEYEIKLKEYTMNPYTGIIHEIKIYPANFLEINANDLYKIFKEYEPELVSVEQNPFDFLRVHATKLIEVGYNFLKKIFGVFEAILRAGQMNPLNVIGYIGTERPEIKLLTKEVPVCNALIEYEAIMPEIKDPYYYTIELSIDGNVFCRQTWYYTFIARGYCTLPGYYPGNYTVEAKMTRYKLVGAYYEVDLEATDSDYITIRHDPFYVNIIEPYDGQEFKTGEKANLTIEVTVPNYDGMRYTLIIKVLRAGVEVANYTEYIQPGTSKKYKYEIIFNKEGTYEILAKIEGYCSPLRRIVDTTQDSIVISVTAPPAPTPIPTPTPTPAPAPAPEVVVTPPAPEVEIIPTVTPPEEEIAPTPAPQTVIEILRRNPWLILVIIAIIAFLIYQMRKTT